MAGATPGVLIPTGKTPDVTPQFHLRFPPTVETTTLHFLNEAGQLRHFFFLCVFTAQLSLSPLTKEIYLARDFF